MPSVISFSGSTSYQPTYIRRVCLTCPTDGRRYRSSPSTDCILIEFRNFAQTFYCLKIHWKLCGVTLCKATMYNIHDFFFSRLLCEIHHRNHASAVALSSSPHRRYITMCCYYFTIDFDYENIVFTRNKFTSHALPIRMCFSFFLSDFNSNSKQKN